MQQANDFIVLNIREYLEDRKLGEEKLIQLLSEFSCPLNVDVQQFLIGERLKKKGRSSIGFPGLQDFDWFFDWF